MATQWPRGMLVQCVLLLAAAALGSAPPAEGFMLIAPLVPGPAAATLDWVLPAGALLVAPGPYAGSIIVFGTRSSLFAKAILHGALLLTGRISGCGSDTKAQS